MEEELTWNLQPRVHQTKIAKENEGAGENEGKTILCVRKVGMGGEHEKSYFNKPRGGERGSRLISSVLEKASQEGDERFN